MKIFILVIGLVLVASFAQADYYIVNKENQVVAVTTYLPDAKDLDNRGEIVVPSKEAIPLENAEYRGGKIVVHTATSAEIAEKAKDSELALEMERINKMAKKTACDQLVAEGVKFSQVKCEDFEK